MDRANDVCQIALVERHRATGEVVNAFVSGFGYTKDCAMASTVAHDSHHMIVVGTNKSDMALAANRLGEVGGGIVMISEGRELALVELPVAGLMSDERAEIVSLRVTVSGVMKKPPQEKIRRGSATPPKSAFAGKRKASFDGRFRDTPTYKRTELLAGNKITGPALIEEHASTTVLMPGDTMTVDAWGNLVIAVAGAK